MKPRLLLMALGAMALFASCTSLKTRTSHTARIQGPVVHTPVLADLDVANTKTTGTATASSGNSIEAVKNLAVADALKTSGADVLVEPTFETQNKSGRMTVLVTGFPAKYTNFRPASTEDIPLMDAGSRYLMTKEATEVAPEKKKGTGAIAGVILLAALVAIMIAAGF